jgi:3-carboxy-cis,cis-muconate cycloisomerase
MSGMMNHAWFGGLLGDPQCADILSPASELARYRAIEVAWVLAQADVGVADPETCALLARHIETCQIPDVLLKAGVMADGVPVPAFVRALKKGAPDHGQDLLHIGLTSQDVMDTALVLALSRLFDIYRSRLSALATTLEALREQNAGRSLMGYTRMQAALPITAEARITTWVRPLHGYIDDLDHIADKLAVLQWGGPVGLRQTSKADVLGPAFAKRLGLRDPGFAWHTTRADLAELGSFVARLTGTFGKMGQDIALMAQRGSSDVVLASGGTSSAMPHKQNPILAEFLVTVAHHTAQQSTLLNVAMVHEQERSGTAWMLEMMTLHDLLQLCGVALRTSQSLVGQITTIGSDP